MARRHTAPFELGVWSTVDAWQAVTLAGGAAVSVSTSPARISGNSGRLLCATAGTLTSRQNVHVTNQTIIGYGRIYLYIATLPAANTKIMNFQSTTNSEQSAIQLNTDGSLALIKADNTQLGSNSSTLSTGDWYRIELKHDATTSPGALEARYVACPGGVDPGSGETVFASGANSSQGSWGRFAIGSFTSTTLDLYFDDVAMNDTTGSAQTGYPGSGHVIMSRPNAGGDSNQWLDNAGSAGTSNNYTLVDEPTVNTTDYVKTTTLNDVDMYNIANFGLSAGDTINVVEMVYRYGNSTADATAQVTPQIIKTSGGTVASGPGNIINATGFTSSNGIITGGKDFKTYLDPDGSAWTNSTIDSMQVGYKLTVATANEIRVTAVWVYVEYIPAAAASTGPRKLPLLGVG